MSICKSEVHRKMPSHPHPQDTSDHNRLVECGEEHRNDDEDENTSASAATLELSNNKPMKLCLLDSNGNQMEISSLDQFKAAVALLENSEHCPMPMRHNSEDSDQTDDDDDYGTSNNLSIRGASTSQQTFLDEVKRFELFRSVIQHEDDLLNQRVSWIILAQSFLMAAFITSTSDDGSGDALKYITAVVGLLTILVTMPAILAAGRNIELQQQVYFARISSEKRCWELHGHGRNILQSNGGKADKINIKEETRERLERGHIFPNMAFRGRGGVPILFTVVGLAFVQVVGWLFLLVALIKGW